MREIADLTRLLQSLKPGSVLLIEVDTEQDGFLFVADEYASSYLFEDLVLDDEEPMAHVQMLVETVVRPLFIALKGLDFEFHRFTDKMRREFPHFTEAWKKLAVSSAEGFYSEGIPCFSALLEEVSRKHPDSPEVLEEDRNPDTIEYRVVQAR